MIPHSRPRFGQPFIDRLAEVAASGVTAMGPESERLESHLAGMLGRSSAAAVDSGTSAIMLALRALSMRRPVTRIGIPAYACSSVLYAVRAAGCEPVAMDCGDDLCLTHDALAQAAALDVVVLVHPFGMVEPLAATQWPCPVIEDIAQSAGATLNGRPLGSFGDVAVASFYATKPWGGAYGGMVLGDDEGLIEALKPMRDPDGATELHNYAGHHQLSDLHAAMARIRIEQAGDESRARAGRATIMDDWFDNEVRPVAGRHDGNSYRYIVRTDGEADRWLKVMRGHGIAAARPVATPASRLLGGEAAGAERAWRDCVSIPLLADASDDEMMLIRAAVKACVR